jgi:6-phosphogluconolactonase
MHRVTRGLLTIMVGIAVSSPIPSLAQPEKAGAVFVMTNAADSNQVIAYARAADGALTYRATYDTQGRGSGGITDPLQSQGSLSLSQDNSLLFVANAGSGTVSVFAVNHAHLAFLDKVPSGGSEPAAVAEHRGLVYVLNKGGAGSVTGFRLDFGGKLTQIKNSTAFLSGTYTGGGSISFSPNGKFLLVPEVHSNNIDVFPVLPSGKLGPIVVNPSPGPGAFSLAFAPDGKAIVAETGPAGGTNAAAMSSYSILPSGELSAVSQSVPTLGAGNCWDVITPNGKWVYASNSASSDISGFAVGAGGTLTPVGDTVVGINPQGSINLDLAITADGKYLYSLNSGTGKIGVFAIQAGGILKALGEAGDLPPSTGFNGIAAL